jgi:hypothetical protein
MKTKRRRKSVFEGKKIHWTLRRMLHDITMCKQCWNFSRSCFLRFFAFKNISLVFSMFIVKEIIYFKHNHSFQISFSARSLMCTFKHTYTHDCYCCDDDIEMRRKAKEILKRLNFVKL